MLMISRSWLGAVGPEKPDRTPSMFFRGRRIWPPSLRLKFLVRPPLLPPPLFLLLSDLPARGLHLGGAEFELRNFAPRIELRIG